MCGICAGVFIKKGAKFVAFILGGTFVLLQVIYQPQNHTFRNLILVPHSTWDLSLSSGSTGLVLRVVSRIYSTVRRTVLDVLPRLDLFGTGSSIFWPQISSRELLSQLGWCSVCGSVKPSVPLDVSYLTVNSECTINAIGFPEVESAESSGRK